MERCYKVDISEIWKDLYHIGLAQDGFCVTYQQSLGSLCQVLFQSADQLFKADCSVERDTYLLWTYSDSSYDGMFLNNV